MAATGWPVAVTTNRNLNARDLIAALHKEVIDWTDGKGATDDVTFFVIKALEEDVNRSGSCLVRRQGTVSMVAAWRHRAAIVAKVELGFDLVKA